MGTINSVILSDACFSLSIGVLKEFTNLNFGYELSLDFAEPSDFYPLLAICSVFTLLFAYLADSYFGKYHITVAGVFFSFMSGLCCEFYYADMGKRTNTLIKSLSMYTLLIYMATSPIRNVILLEQVKFKLVYIRRYLFFLVFSRLAVRGLNRFFSILPPQELISQMTSTLAFLGTLMYFLVFPCCLGAMLLFEPIYYGITHKCIACFFRAFKKVIFYGGKGKKQAVHRVHFEKISSGQEKISRCLRLTSGETFSTEAELNPREKLQHWLNKAKPKNNDMEISQTYEAYKIIPFLLFGVYYSYLSYYITDLTVMQHSIVKKNNYQILDTIDVVFLIILMTILLLPIVEFGLFPFFSKFFKRDTYIFTAGYGFLILSLGMAIFCQYFMLDKLVYIPTDGLLQIRVFNSIGKEVYIKSSERTYTVPEYGYTLLKDVVYDVRKDKIFFSKNSSKEGFSPVHFNVGRVPIVSLLVTEENITLSNKEPTLYYRLNGDLESLVHVTVPFINSSVVCTFIDFVNGVSYSSIVTKDLNVLSVRPGEYKIEVNIEFVGSYLSAKSVTIEHDLYSIFPFKRQDRMEVAVNILETSIPITYIFLLPQIAAMCLGNAVATISFLRFIFLESPNKLRCCVFAFIFSINILFISNQTIASLNEITPSFVLLALSLFIFVLCLSASVWYPYRTVPYGPPDTTSPLK